MLETKSRGKATLMESPQISAVDVVKRTIALRFGTNGIRSASAMNRDVPVTAPPMAVQCVSDWKDKDEIRTRIIAKPYIVLGSDNSKKRSGSE